MAIVEFLLVQGSIVAVEVPTPSIAAGTSFTPPPVAAPPGYFEAGADYVFIIAVDVTDRVNESIENNNTVRDRCIS